MSLNKVVIIVLVAVAMLFVVGLALGSGNHGDTARPDARGFLSHLQAGKFLQVEDKVTATGCASASPGRVVVTSSECTIDVPEGGFLARPTRIAAVPATAVTVIVTPRRNGPQLTKFVPAGECLGSALDGKGGTVVIGPSLGGFVSVELRTTRCQ